MKFGKFDVDGAAGAILAHSIQTPNGRMRKGIVIGEDDIATLKSAGDHIGNSGTVRAW